MADLPILTPSECAALVAIEAKMTPGEWESLGNRLQKSGLPMWAVVYGQIKQSDADALGIIELRNAAPRLLATIAELREEVDAWKFVPDDSGGHMLSTRTGDKWYPESFMRKEIAAHEATIAELTTQAEQRRVIFDEALEHLKTEPVHLVLFESNVRLRERIAELEKQAVEAED